MHVHVSYTYHAHPQLAKFKLLPTRVYECKPVRLATQVSLFAIKDGRVFFRNKFVRTEALMREQEAQKVRAVLSVEGGSNTLRACCFSSVGFSSVATQLCPCSLDVILTLVRCASKAQQVSVWQLPAWYWTDVLWHDGRCCTEVPSALVTQLAASFSTPLILQ